MLNSKTLPWSPRVEFALHAPPVPNDFETKTESVVRTADGKFYVTQTIESELARIVRWRLAYADAVVKALRESAPSVE